MISGLDGNAADHAALLRALAPLLRAFYRRRWSGGGDDIEDLVQETLIAGLDNALVQDSVKQALPGSFARHRKLVERLDELVAAVGAADLYSTSLAQTLGVSVRTLQTAVQHICGVSLHQHLRSKRMWSVRRLLVKGSPLLTVTAAAHANGFWHLSDFARCYGRAYGEMPSETLARARGI
jgi:AraC family ethanolamine operon transcriptional activator